MIFELTDIVETGLWKNGATEGGSIKMTCKFSNLLSSEEKTSVLKIIDMLDHCTITENINIPKYNERYFIYRSMRELSFSQIATWIVYHFMKYYKITFFLEAITFSLGKEVYTFGMSDLEDLDKNVFMIECTEGLKSKGVSNDN